MNIAITGASGFIGGAIVKKACQNGHKVTALVRESSNRAHIDSFVSEFVVGSQDDATSINTLIEKADVVIHNSFDWSLLQKDTSQLHFNSNLLGSINMLEGSADRHFIYMSTIAVHHHMHEKWNGNIDEAHPTRPGSTYGACKAAVEAHMWAANANRKQRVTAIRPCAVYGMDPKVTRSIGWPIVKSIGDGAPFTKAGGGKFVHVDDVAAATVAAFENKNTSPRVYNLVDCYARWSDWAQITADELGCNATIDSTSTAEPKNSFDTTDVTIDLGVLLDRGFDGIRAQIKELIDAR